MDPGNLDHHQASPDRAAMGLSLVGLVRDVASRHMDLFCVVETWPCHLLAPALPAEEGQDVGRKSPPLAQAAPGKEDFSSSQQVTMLALLKSTSYLDMWLNDISPGTFYRIGLRGSWQWALSLQRGGGTRE